MPVEGLVPVVVVDSDDWSSLLLGERVAAKTIPAGCFLNVRSELSLAPSGHAEVERRSHWSDPSCAYARLRSRLR